MNRLIEQRLTRMELIRARNEFILHPLKWQRIYHLNSAILFQMMMMMMIIIIIIIIIIILKMKITPEKMDMICILEIPTGKPARDAASTQWKTRI